MPRYRTKSRKPRIVVLHGTPDEAADALEEQLRAIRARERAGDLGQSTILRDMKPLDDEEIDERDRSWERYSARLVRELRGAVPA